MNTHRWWEIITIHKTDSDRLHIYSLSRFIVITGSHAAEIMLKIRF